MAYALVLGTSTLIRYVGSNPISCTDQHLFAAFGRQ
jgi:hypothetical protein